jgi:hypothetical protein
LKRNLKKGSLRKRAGLLQTPGAIRERSKKGFGQKKTPKK